MKSIVLFFSLFLTINSLVAQSAMLEYNEVQVITDDTITIKNSSVVMFSRQTLIIQNEDRRVNSFLVPGSEFDKLDVIIFDDTNTLLESDSLSKTILYGSVNHPVELGVVIGETINDSLKIYKKNRETLIFIR
tara:strand:- start:206 stop:604 length:399 start_codon:yes stop_codon:yes gene_type:complete